MVARAAFPVVMIKNSCCVKAIAGERDVHVIALMGQQVTRVIDGAGMQAQARPQPHAHALQFYENDGFLADVVADFLREGLSGGQPAIVLATPEHRRAFADRLASSGVDVRAAEREGDLTFLDAGETLRTFMLGDRPDPARFRATVGDIVGSRRARAIPRAYGEMVDLLWKANNREGALELEALWNDLSSSYEFQLLCAYSIGSFLNVEDCHGFDRVCGQHSHVAPTERHVQNELEPLKRELSRLEQRAMALETEVTRRLEVERRLAATVTTLRGREGELRAALQQAEEARAEAERARAEAERARGSAEQANRVKSEFLAVMSHELRTPLNAIGGYAELLELGIHGPVTSEQRDALERIQRSQRMLLGHINEVLNYARIERGSLRYEMSAVPVDALLRPLEALILPQLLSRSLHFVYEGCASELRVHADGEKLQQIILNLLANAIKFTEPAGTVGIAVDADETEIRIRVYDTGIGIPATKLLSIFDPFVQVDAHYTRTREGVGLGLAISRDLARGMGGDLVVSSEVARGSEFTVVLARAAADRGTPSARLAS